MLRMTDVVRHLLILNVLVFLAASFFFPQQSQILALFYPASGYFQPFQLITHMFMHADFMHLFFNMFALYMFGSALESVWGGNRFLLFYFACGLGAMVLHLLVWWLEVRGLSASQYQHFLSQPYRVMGASGAVFGLLAGFGTMFPETRVMLLFPPIPMKAKYFALIFAGLELFFGISSFNTGIAHFAHVGGAVVGFALILYWKRTGQLWNR